MQVYENKSKSRANHHGMMDEKRESDWRAQDGLISTKYAGAREKQSRMDHVACDSASLWTAYATIAASMPRMSEATMVACC